MDREKVIKGLELCTNISQDGCLMLCPYKDEKDETYSGFCEQVLKQDALDLLKEQKELLKEQEAVEPILEQDSMVCGVCGHEVIWQKMLGDEIWADEKLDYCPRCGRAVKWG